MKEIITFLTLFPMVARFYIKCLKATYKAVKAGEASCYTNIKESWWEFTKAIIFDRKEIILHSKEGNLVVIHGNPSAKIPFQSPTKSTELELALSLEKGKYILVSCHNYYHKDIEINGVKLTREQNTITKYPILATYIPLLNKVYLVSNKEIGKLYEEMGMPMDLMEEGFDSTIWKNVERTVRVISEDELPEDIKKKLTK